MSGQEISNAELDAAADFEDRPPFDVPDGVIDSHVDPLDVPDEEAEQRAREQFEREQREREQAQERGDAVPIEQLMETYGIAKPWTSAELDAAEIQTTFLVDGVLVEGQPALFAGASKTCKTSAAIDLSLSLGLSRRFLGEFWVPEPKRVLFLSAESGQGVIQETARRVARSKGCVLDDEQNVHWGFWVPKAKNSEQLTILDHQLADSEADVCVIDPLYMSLDGEDQANLSMNGQQMQSLTERCLSRGVTPVLIDHVKRSSVNAQNNRPLELNDVSGAGKAEFMRQWILISRREQFDPEEQIHRLWMSIGGSAGHCGLWAVEIDETRDELTETRRWTVSVDNASEARRTDAEQEAVRKEEEKEQARRAKLERDSEAIKEAFVGAGSNGLTKTAAKARANLNTNSAGAAIAKLLRESVLEECRVKNNGGTYDGFRINPSWSAGPDRSDRSDKW